MTEPTQTTRTIYYADEWMCEFPGVSGDLTEVADLLANGGPVGREEGDPWWPAPQPIPSTHPTSKMTYFYVPCLRAEDGTYSIPDDLPGRIHAVAFGDGLGWWPEMLCNDREEAQEMLEKDGEDPVEYLVCAAPEVRGAIHLAAGPVATFEAE